MTCVSDLFLAFLRCLEKRVAGVFGIFLGNSLYQAILVKGFANFHKVNLQLKLIFQMSSLY